MIWFMDTLLCKICDSAVICELQFDCDFKNGRYSKEEIEELNK